MSTDSAIAHPPETLEGWYCLHQIVRAPARMDGAAALCAALTPSDPVQGWSTAVALIGSVADVMFIHFRPTLDSILEAQSGIKERISADARVEYSFLSVTEAGLYHVTAELAKEAEARGGKVGDDAYRAALAERSKEQLENAHVRKRLYPELPAGMPYVCFYPMTKRRDAGQNWYTLSLGERSRLMMAHGATGRRYAGRVQQVITGAIGFDSWEWGVTLFAADPLDFKKLVTDMRFDEVSAKYAEFGNFYVGKILDR